ncbi:hypothetical protein BaRGS_00004282 [Batillaria attramentaria]|uniref:Uncharacterized protein n=1 Tax=Batillaria attramentaria TaxID=370345 RepID=A0ABD0LY57_9CAEN
MVHFFLSGEGKTKNCCASISVFGATKHQLYLPTPRSFSQVCLTVVPATSSPLICTTVTCPQSAGTLPVSFPDHFLSSEQRTRDLVCAVKCYVAASCGISGTQTRSARDSCCYLRTFWPCPVCLRRVCPNWLLTTLARDHERAAKEES